MRLRDVPLGSEQIERIGLTDDEPELARERVEVHGLRLCLVDPAEIDDELVIDVTEEIVVARERERLAALVRELDVDLVGEVEVVIVPLVAEALPVDRKERLAVVREHAAP